MRKASLSLRSTLVAVGWSLLAVGAAAATEDTLLVPEVGDLASTTPESTFSISSLATYDQCSNDSGTGFTIGDTGCRWITGSLQVSNSTYLEGDSTVHRVWLTQLVPGSTHTLTLKYGTTKGGKHAYDFLTTWTWSEIWVDDADRCQGVTGCTTAAETALPIPQDPNVPDSFEPSGAGRREFVLRGGTLTSASLPMIVSGSYAGDSETVITVGFTVGPSGGPLCASGGTCAVVLWFGAHVAAQANWGLGMVAKEISGSPYHVALDTVDGAPVGQNDHLMQSDVVKGIPNGTIVIVEDTVPDDPQDFTFDLNNNGTIDQGFLLDDDADPTLPKSSTFSVPPGTWYAREPSLPSGWGLTDLVCIDPTGNTTSDVGTRVATISLNSPETVTCTFTHQVRPVEVCNGIDDDGDGVVPSTEIDNDGDGYVECSPWVGSVSSILGGGDCNDAQPAEYPGAPQICDGLNNDCADPSWPALPSGETDADGDGVRACAGDCNNADATVWAIPSEVLSLVFISKTTMSWTAPVLPGGTTLLFDTVRSTSPSDWVHSALCLETDGLDTQSDDGASPPVGGTLQYLVRAGNSCGEGSSGTRSDGLERSVVACP